ncbi:MAG: helix-turn-helix domain-containing protein [Lachnospiraceae bacterium]|nr:helix-turn-helix domain-containing protein [Lachnospiraceae bacterium]
METNKSKIPKIYGLDDVSRMLGIPKGTLYNMKWRGLLPCIKIGKRIKMTEEHILQVINMGGNLYGG